MAECPHCQNVLPDGETIVSDELIARIDSEGKAATPAAATPPAIEPAAATDRESSGG